MARLLAERLWGVLPWSILALVAIVIAGVYVVVDTSNGASGLSYLILRWFHSLCWVLLAAAAVAMSRLTPMPVEWAVPLGIAGGVVYAIFLITTLSNGGSAL
jgi:hypothetical protein